MKDRLYKCSDGVPRRLQVLSGNQWGRDKDGDPVITDVDYYVGFVATDGRHVVGNIFVGEEGKAKAEKQLQELLNKT